MSNQNVGIILFIGIVLGNLMKKSMPKKENEIKETRRQDIVLDEIKNKV